MDIVQKHDTEERKKRFQRKRVREKHVKAEQEVGPELGLHMEGGQAWMADRAEQPLDA